MVPRLLIGLGLVLVFVAAQAAFTIGEWEQGMVVQFGNPKRIIQEPGLYFKLPVAQNLVRFEKRVLTTDARESWSTTSRAGVLTIPSNSTGASATAFGPWLGWMTLFQPVSDKKSLRIIFSISFVKSVKILWPS